MNEKQVTEFVEAVKNMRKAQQNYFKYKAPVDMQAAIKAEKQVDKQLEEIASGQISLF